MANKTKKHVVIDARMRQTTTGRYMDNLIQNLQDQAMEYTVSVLINPNDNWKPTANNFSTVPCAYKPYSFNPIKQVTFSYWLYKLDADLIHFTMSPQDPIFYRKKIITTTHDLTVLKYKISSKFPSWVNYLRQKGYKFLMWQSNKKAKHVIVPTQYVADDLNKKYLFTNRKTTVTLEASDPPLAVKASEPDNSPEKFIMYVGNAYEFKNLERLVGAFCVLKEHHSDLKLVFVGKKKYHLKKFQNWCKKQPFYDDIVFTGFIPDEELKWYYQNARAYVFPSLSEGFGLPGLEAMVHGCPVVSSNATCLPEVYGDAAHYFDPNNVEDMSVKISEVLKDKKLRTKLVKNGYEQVKKYSWSQMAEQTLEVYKKAIG